MEWISVKERLPESGQEVLLWAVGMPWGGVCSRYDMGVYNPDVYQPWWDYVTHWMPLPEAPKDNYCPNCGAKMNEGEKNAD